MNAVVEQAYKVGYYWERVEPGLIYFAQHASRGTNVTGESLEFVKREFTNKPAPHAIYLNMLNDSSLFFFPLGLSLSMPEYTFDFWFGELIIIIFIDMAYLNLEFERRGLKITEYGDDNLQYEISSLTGNMSSEIDYFPSHRTLNI